MRTFASLLLIVLSTVMLSGCGSDVDSLARNQIILYNDLVKAVENDAPQEEQDAIVDQIAEINDTLKAMDLSAEEQKRIHDKFGTELNRAYRRLAAISLKMKQDNIPVDRLIEGLPSIPDSQLPLVDDLPSAADLPPIEGLPPVEMDIDQEAIKEKATEMQNETGAMMQNFADQFRKLDQGNPTKFSPQVKQPSP